jgi:ABC-2 type transport system permease protein
VTRDIRQVVGVELRKLGHQWVPRLLILLSVALPIVFAVAVKLARATPGDTLMGAFVHSSGFDVPLVELAFMASFGFPAIAALLAGDSFASEDRHDAWKNVLTRAMDRRAVFLGKCLAAALFAGGLLVVLAVVSTAAGVLLVGADPLIGLSGQTVGAGTAFGLTLLAWLLDLPPLLAFVALAVLASVATRNGIAGVLAPVVLALLMQLLGHVGNGGVGHQLELLTAFDAWHGLFTRPLLALPLVGVGVSLIWGALALALAWWLFSRRDFSGSTTAGARTRIWVGVGSGLAAIIAALFGLCFVGPSRVTPARLQAELGPVFSRLAADQTLLLRHQVVSAHAIHDRVICYRRSGATRGAGDDWICAVSVTAQGSASAIPTYSPLDFDLSVKTNACYSADGDPTYVGAQTYPEPRGGRVTNPLFEFYACFNPL